MNVRADDIICVRTTGLFAQLIRWGAALRHQPHQQDHVGIVVDDAGTVVQAMPSGVCLGNAADYPAKWTISNVGQPKTDEQRAAVVAAARSMLNVRYDFEAIAADAGNCLDIDDPWVKDWPKDTVPTSVVCSSLAAWVYGKVGLECPPGGKRFCTPAAWSLMIQVNHWASVAEPENV